MIFELMKSMMPNSVYEHRDKVEASQIIGEYIKIQRKESKLSRNQRDTIVSKFNNYKRREFYSEKDLQKIQFKINEQ